MHAKTEARLKRLQIMPTTEERKVEGRTPVTYQFLTAFQPGSGGRVAKERRRGR
jgi:hypothetical protein